MKIVRNTALTLAGIYLLWVAFDWVWFAPTLVTRRLDGIHEGMHSSEVSSVLKSTPAFDVPARAYCAPRTNVVVTRISLYDPGGVSLFIMTIPTTVTFCYDSKDMLVGFKVSRWMDGP
jgi:hypothetical protein